MKDFEKRFKSIQSEIINLYSGFEKSKKASIISDSWKRPEGGGGRTFVIQEGAFLTTVLLIFLLFLVLNYQKLPLETLY